ncbi:hypothetical protein C0971_10180 [Bacillus methanolicus]|nr:hypothetical protein C0971_10180 [Bacillus methanolicus]
MSLTDKEIALELTKAYLEHLNTRVNNKAPQSHADVKFVVGTYSAFYNLVSSVDKKGSTNNE